MEALQVEQIAQRYHLTPAQARKMPADTMLHIALVTLGQEALSGRE